jgi:hypothetical protein
MEDNLENKALSDEPQIIAEQKALLQTLEDQYKSDPSPKLELEIQRRKDTILHLETLAKGDPRERARKAAEKARLFALGKAIQQLPD